MSFFSLFQPKTQKNLDPHQKEIQDYKKQLQAVTNDTLLSNFRSDSWEKINDADKRIALLQEVENRNAADQGREPCTVKKLESLTTDYGVYSGRSRTISVNINDQLVSNRGIINNSSYEVLDTIYHEGEHAYQDKCIETKTGLPKTTIDMCDVENVPGNYQGKIPYDHCTCEVDSNNVAVNKVMDSGKLFEGDPKYSEYLEKRSHEMEIYTDVDMDQVRAEQLDAVQNCQDRWAMSRSRCDDIRKNDIAEDQTQPVFEEAKNSRERLNQEKIRNDMAISEKEEIHTQNEIASDNESYQQDEFVDGYSEDEERKYKR